MLERLHVFTEKIAVIRVSWWTLENVSINFALPLLIIGQKALYRTQVLNEIDHRTNVITSMPVKSFTFNKMPKPRRGGKKFHHRQSRKGYTPSFSSIPEEVLPTCRHALPLPISTRAIGFAVSYTYSYLSRFRHFAMSIHQLYRASLIQLQAQLFEASESMYKHQIIPKDYHNMYMSLKDRKFVNREDKNFRIITTIINNVGPFSHNGISYQPYLPETKIPNAFNLTINNLRETVVALSSEKEDTKESRWIFYQHNSIPGAIWEIDENTEEARLLNADEIIPAEYDLCDDYNKFVDCIMTISQEYFNHMGKLEYSGKGSASQLISIRERCISRIPASELTNKKPSTVKHLPPIDHELIAYAFGDLKQTDIFYGIVGLYGEHCQHDADYQTWGCRSDLSGSSSISYSWENCAFSILNNSTKLKYGSSDSIAIPDDFTAGSFALPIPVSSRGIGFAVSYIYSTLSEYKNVDIDIFQLFRASLLQFQYRVFKSSEYKFKNLVVPKNFFKIFQQISDPCYIRPNKNNFRIIATVINSFGPFDRDGIEYHPCLPETSVPNPFNVTIENLRQTVQVLSSTTTEGKPTRWNFYNHNSIPGSVWKVNDIAQDAVLINPDDIIPPDYKPVDDLEALTRCMSVMETKQPEYVGTLNYLGRGNPCQLVNIQEHCTDKIPTSKQTVIDGTKLYQHYPPNTKGIIAHARGNLSTQEMLLGILGLYGEHCRHNVNYEIWGCRSPSTGSCSAPITLWNTVARYCIKLDIQ